MSIPVQHANNVKIYNVSGQNHHRLPDWMVKKHSKTLRKDEGYSRRMQLIQDFDFPEASLRLATTRDGQHIVATGVYKPQFRVFDLAEKALKFERHTAAENVAMQLLGDDWKKIALLQTDRYVEFHSSSGIFHSARIPKMGRDMIYDTYTCDMLVAASSAELYRLNLDRGQFLAPFETQASAVNSVHISPFHGLYALACDNGAVEFWDRRDRRRMGALQISRSTDYFTLNMNSSLSSTASKDDGSLEATAVHFLPDGLHWAAGTGDGQVLVFDLRANERPLDVRDHHNGYAVKKIDYHAGRGLLVSTDRRGIKFWHGPSHSRRGIFTAIESPEVDINDFSLQGDTGLVLATTEAAPIAAYFVPDLGPAPRWCSFLENLTEEMEENVRDSARAAVYENFKFVTRSELAQLGLDHLIGSNLLRAYMHGYFIDLRLYEKAKAIANPFAYEEYLARRKADKLERERASRIRAKDPLKKAKVNRSLVERLVAEEHVDLVEEEDEAKVGTVAKTKREKQKRRAKDTAQALLHDDRFSSLFQDPDFEIDQDSAEYKSIHPAYKKKQTTTSHN